MSFNNRYLSRVTPSVTRTSRSNWNLEVLVSVEGGKPEFPEKNHRSRERTNNKLNPHETLSTGIEPRSQRWDWGERLSTAPVMLPKHPTVKSRIHLKIIKMMFSSCTRENTFGWRCHHIVAEGHDGESYSLKPNQVG